MSWLPFTIYLAAAPLFLAHRKAVAVLAPWQTSVSSASRRQNADPAIDRWQTPRGAAVLWQGRVQLDGAFPGSAHHGGALPSARALLTPELLVVNDGRADGFVLPIAVITAVLHADNLPGAATLIVHYRTGHEEYGFALRAAAGWTRRPGSLAPLESALTSAELPPTHAALQTLQVAATLAPDRFQETVIWHGSAAVPTFPWGTPEPCHLWLSTRALFWRFDETRAVGVLPLAALLDQTPVSATADHPAALVHLGYATDEGARRDLTLRFDRQTAANNTADCRAVATGLRSRGVVLRPAPEAVQPWRVAPPTAPTAPVPRRPVLALVPKPNPDSERIWQACEAGLLAGLTGLTDRLRRPDAEQSLPDSDVALGAALAALEAAERGGDLRTAEVALRRDRLLALAAATSRLRGLVQLAEAGHLTGVDLEARRAHILEPLADLLARDVPPDTAGETSA